MKRFLPAIALAVLIVAVAVPGRARCKECERLRPKLEQIERFAVARDRAVYDWVKANDYQIAVRKLNQRFPGLDLPVLPPAEPWGPVSE